MDYEHLHVIQPVFTDTLRNELNGWLDQAEAQGKIVPPALCHRRYPPPQADSTNKQKRLDIALWVFERLSPNRNDQDAINQLACTLDMVEALARQRYFQAVKRHKGLLLDEKPLRLPQPYPEPCHGQALLVSHAIRHIILIQPNGSVQIQFAPAESGWVDYARHAKTPGHIALTKPGAGENRFWM